MIRFPKHHIATSVVNRILNVADELEADAVAASPFPRTSAPALTTDPGQQSAALDQALAAPQPATPGIEASPDPGATIQGKPLLDTLLSPEQ